MKFVAENLTENDTSWIYGSWNAGHMWLLNSFPLTVPPAHGEGANHAQTNGTEGALADDALIAVQLRGRFCRGVHITRKDPHRHSLVNQRLLKGRNKALRRNMCTRPAKTDSGGVDVMMELDTVNNLP